MENSSQRVVQTPGPTVHSGRPKRRACLLHGLVRNVTMVFAVTLLGMMARNWSGVRIRMGSGIGRIAFRYQFRACHIDWRLGKTGNSTKRQKERKQEGFCHDVSFEVTERLESL